MVIITKYAISSEYSNVQHEDRSLQFTKFDCDINGDKTFALTIPDSEMSDSIEVGNYVYFINEAGSMKPTTAEESYALPEWGGIVQGFEKNSTEQTITITGLSWRGWMAQKVVCPSEGEDYYYINGDNFLKAIYSTLGAHDIWLGYQSWSEIDYPSEFNYQCPRYCTLLEAIEGFCAAYGFTFFIYTVSRQWGNDLYFGVRPIKEVETKNINYIAKKENGINHLILLGQGELSEREVKHLYISPTTGEIVRKDSPVYWWGMKEREAVYDNSGATGEELYTYGEQRFKELLGGKKITINSLGESGEQLFIGDSLTQYDSTLGEWITATINNKIYTEEAGLGKIEYQAKTEE